MSCRAVVKVRRTASTVSERGHSQAASMCALPSRSIFACWRMGCSGARMCWALRNDASKAAWSSDLSASVSMAAIAASTVGKRSRRGVGSAGRRLAAVMHWMRMSWGFGRALEAGSSGLGSTRRLTPEKVLSSTVCRSFTATSTLSPGLAGAKRTMGSRSSPRATRRPLK